MKKLCFGTIFTLLCQTKNSKNQNWLYLYLVTPNSTANIEPDGGSVGARKSSTDDLPQTEKDFFNIESIETIVGLYRSKLPKVLKNGGYKEAFVLAIKDVLQEDTTIADTDIIGFNGFTKKSIIESDTFDFYALIASLMRYCSNIVNTGYKANIREITSTYISNKLTSIGEIHLVDDEIAAISTPLTLTIDAARFSSVFTEVNPNAYSLSLPNPNKVKLYKLRVTNNEFDKAPISDFILDNISQYVYSRTKIKDISAHHNVKTISTRAIRELSSTPAFTDQKNTFCEMMLYSFMESSMSAPKIMSGFEVDAAGRSNKFSSGIYLLPAGTVSTNNQIVFGCTQAHDNIQNAIDDVLSQATNIKINRTDEIHLLDPSVLNTILEPSVSEYVKNIIIPKRDSEDEPDDAFGLFISYTIDIPGKDTMSNSAYRSALQAKMDSDITSAIPYIINKINILGLSHHSFYLFILPLDKVEDDTRAIISMSVGGGD